MTRETRADQEPRLCLELADGDVHLWQARLELGDLELDEAGRVLSVDELARARRFHRPSDARQFVAARLILRRLLGGYLDVDPRVLRFAYNPNGKPGLTGEHAEALSFNVAHSHGAALYAFARGRQVGVDLELMQTDLATLEIARQFFAPEEIGALCAAPAVERVAAFYRCWTRKEAYLKARGWGLATALNAFAVSLAPAERSALLWDRVHPEDVRRWFFFDVFILPGYAAAVAVEETQQVSRADCEWWDWDLRRGVLAAAEFELPLAHAATLRGPLPSS